MSAQAAFYNNFGIWKYFFRQKKNDKDIEYWLCFIWAPQTGKATDVQKELFFINLLKLESDIKEHSNNKVIINLL